MGIVMCYISKIILWWVIEFLKKHKYISFQIVKYKNCSYGLTVFATNSQLQTFFELEKNPILATGSEKKILPDPFVVLGISVSLAMKQIIMSLFKTLISLLFKLQLKTLSISKLYGYYSMIIRDWNKVKVNVNCYFMKASLTFTFIIFCPEILSAGRYNL